MGFLKRLLQPKKGIKDMSFEEYYSVIDKKEKELFTDNTINLASVNILTRNLGQCLEQITQEHGMLQENTLRILLRQILCSWELRKQLHRK